MANNRTIDVHAHIIETETIELVMQEAPDLAPTLTAIDDEFAVFEIAGRAYRPFPRGGWDVGRRLGDMNKTAVDVQVLSVPPQTFLYDQDPGLASRVARIQNEQLTKLVNRHPDRFAAIGTVAMQSPAHAVSELRYAMESLGHCGLMIGSNIAGKNLDDPDLEPFWAAANELEAFILIHPVQVAGIERLRNYYLVNLIGNPLDTTIAAACLLFGGVLDRHPAINFCLSHGGGFVPYQAGRFLHGWHVRPEPKVALQEPPRDLIRRFYYDTILHADAPLDYLVGVAGADRVLLGSDYPFDMAMLNCVGHVRDMAISEHDQATILGEEAKRILKID